MIKSLDEIRVYWTRWLDINLSPQLLDRDDVQDSRQISHLSVIRIDECFPRDGLLNVHLQGLWSVVHRYLIERNGLCHVRCIALRNLN